MKREDAFYHKILLMTDLDDGYDEWLNGYLESEKPLSDVVLELVYCGSDVNKIISVLHNFCNEHPFDKSVVCDRLREYFKDAYYTNKMSKDEITTIMHRVVLNILETEDFDVHLWGSLYYLDDYYYFAEEGVIPWESFNSAFLSYLDNGVSIDSDPLHYNNQIEKGPTFIDRIKHIFKRFFKR